MDTWEPAWEGVTGMTGIPKVVMMSAQISPTGASLKIDGPGIWRPMAYSSTLKRIR